jgi:ABC-type transport system involved in multi-copper enzyme maturation permease subunit
MSALVRAELFKQRSTRTALGLLAVMAALVLFAVLLHGFGLAADDLGRNSAQQVTRLFSPGEKLGALFAALLGAMSITAEIRHGTTRPTFLITPWRGRVIAAKVLASILIGAGFGLTAAGAAAAAGSVALRARGIDVQLDGGDYLLLIAGATAAAALWAAIGVGVGALVRSQAPALIGLCAWLLFIEGLLLGDVADISDVGRFAPGAAAAAITGQDPDKLLAPAIGLALLVMYAAGAAVAGALSTSRRDVA